MEKSIKKSNSVNYIIVLLYLFTMFVPSLGAFDFAATQWLYLGLLNTAVFLYYLTKPEYLLFNSSRKIINLFFGILLASFIVSALSMTQSLIIDESIIYISRIFTFIVGVFNLYIVFKRQKEYSFLGLGLIMSVVLFIESLEVIYYFSSNFNVLRTQELINKIPHRYGNRNILASAIVIKLPFLLYLVQQINGIKKVFVSIAAFFAITSLFLIGARTAVLIMAIILLSFSLTYFVVLKYSLKRSLKTIVLLLSITIISFIYSISINKIHNNKLNSYKDLFFTKKEKDLYNPKAETNLVDGSGRSYIWQSAIKDFKKSPIIGVGIGNWRHNSKADLLINNRGKGIVFNTHVHNDYLQSLAETGIIGFLLYLSIYVISFLVLYRNYISSQKVSDKVFVITICLALVAYMIDAFFNFPHHRAPIQIVFALILSIIIGSSIKKNKTLESKNIKGYKVIGIIVIGLLLVNLFSHYKDYKSSKVQFLLMSEVKTKDAFTSKYKYTYAQMNEMLLDFPYVNQIGMTNDDIKGLFAINNKKYDQAITHLDESISNVENNMWPKTLKAMVFNFKKEEDSAYYYSKEVFDLAPSVESNFYILQSIYKRRKDTLGLFDLYKRHFKVRPDNTVAWLNMCNDIRNYYRDDSLALNKVDEALKRYPYNKELLSYKGKLDSIMSKRIKSDIIASKLDDSVINKMTEYFKKGNEFFSQKDYNNARIQFLKVLELEPNNLPTHFKLGLLENLTKNYKKAIPYFTKVIDDKYLDNGRPEYSRGVSYLKLNNMDAAKKDFLVSRNMAWPAALKLNDAFFK